MNILTLTNDFIQAVDNLVCCGVTFDTLSHYVSVNPKYFTSFYNKATTGKLPDSAKNRIRMNRIVTVYRFYVRQGYMPDMDRGGNLI